MRKLAAIAALLALGTVGVALVTSCSDTSPGTDALSTPPGTGPPPTRSSAPASPSAVTRQAGPRPARATAGKRQRATWLLTRLRQSAPSGASSYRRSAFGDWIDADHDGCNTRKEVLIAESRTPVQVSGSSCTLSGGTWVSWYDGVTTRNPSTFDIDHVVPLEEVWVSGGRAWTAARRLRYANDLGLAWTLDAVTAHSNRSKGDRDPSQWLPDRNRCTYAVHWLTIKYRWGLSIDPAEAQTLRGLLAGSCGRTLVRLPAKG